MWDGGVHIVGVFPHESTYLLYTHTLCVDPHNARVDRSVYKHVSE